MTRVDLHFHLLPGLDDGPATIEETIDLGGAAAREGTSTIVVTPHVRPDYVNDVEELPDLVREVEDRLRREGVDVSVVCGAELGHAMVGRLSQGDLETVAVGPRGARWLLVETPFEGLGENVSEAADELRDRGFGVVLAHPERSAGLLDTHAQALRCELDRRTLLQVSAPSLVGDHGPGAQAVATRLVTAGLADVIASDAHSVSRAPSLTAGVEAAVARGVPATAALRLTDANPARLLRRGMPAPQPLAA